MQKVKETKAETRVRLAKDVLRQLRTKKIAVQSGDYVRIQDIFGNKLATCQVCAAGALAVACCGVPTFNESEHQIVECLTPYFNRRQLALIEAAFEGRDEAPLTWGQVYSKAALRKAALFGVFEQTKPEWSWKTPQMCLNYTETLQRRQLRLIMQNIIDNGGTFKP